MFEKNKAKMIFKSFLKHFYLFLKQKKIMNFIFGSKNIHCHHQNYQTREFTKLMRVS